MFNLLHLTLLLAAINCSVALKLPQNLQCKDENDQPVDWYVMYKIPKISQSSNPLIRGGLAYLYITSNLIKDGWKLSQKSIDSTDSIPGKTLAPLYEQGDSNLWTIYNDQPPNENASSNFGHTKGVVMANAKQGFWLVHSVPQFPPTPNTGNDPPIRSRKERAIGPSPAGQYSYPSSGERYGQSFLCISVNNSQFDLIGRQLMYNQIIPYKNNLPEVLARQYPVLTNAANKVRVKDAPYKSKVVIGSLNAVEFTSFAKSDKWNEELYDDFVAPQLRSDLFTETWINGRGKLPSDCKGVKVMNVESIVLNKANVDFKTSHDHSKWAISANSKKQQGWVCVGDINRAETQSGRGGGTVCLNSHDLWQNYRNAVNDVEACPKKSFSSKERTRYEIRQLI